MAYEPRGLYLEEFEIGRTYTSLARTITEADVVNFAGVSGDFNPLHMDEEFGKTNQFGRRVAHGALGFIVSTGLSNQTGLYEGTTIAFIECTVKYTAPLLIGDTVHIDITPIEIRHSSKPGKGILKQDLKLLNQDVYVNIVGGLRPEGTYTDLAVALAIYSSYTGKKLDSKTLVLGEIGLTGDLRAVQNSDKIVKEAQRLGFERIVLPIKNAERAGSRASALDVSNIEIIGLRNIAEAKKLF